MSKFKIARQIPTDVLFKRIIKKLLPQPKIKYASTEHRSFVSDLELNTIIKPEGLGAVQTKRILYYINNEFDLLGSGWKNREASEAIKVLKVHQSVSHEIFNLLPEKYQLIDWQIDIKSGYQFQVQHESSKQRFGKGVDVKNCWELGRLQHLPQLALCQDTTIKEEKLVDTFKFHCLDFIGSNPVGMGIQWSCTMDVAIRVCNLLVAYDLILARDKTGRLSNDFKGIVTDAVYQHGKYIYNHLEHKEGAAGNHYLFNLVGLLFVANYLKETKETAGWKAFATHELKIEFEKQFFEDGGNFEGSTTYHCLSAEAMLYGVVMMLRNGDSLGQRFVDKLKRSVKLISDILKPDGTIPQLGDNDSGRLFKLLEEDDNLLNYEGLLAGFSGLFQDDFSEFREKYPMCNQVVSQLANGKQLSGSEATLELTHGEQSEQLDNSQETVLEFEKQINQSTLVSIAYPNFGVYGFKSDEFYLMISAISNSSMHHSWGHVHNDKLSFELFVQGKEMVKDPGSGVYTSDIKTRNLFRSTKAHHGIVVGEIEQNKMIHTFYLDRESTCELIAFDEKQKVIELEVSYYGVTHRRRFTIHADKLVVVDWCNQPFTVNINAFEKYSPNYGSIV